MLFSRKISSRREEIRKNRPDVVPVSARLAPEGTRGSLAIAAGFFLVASAIMMLREDVVPYRPGQYVAQDILSRVEFKYPEKEQLQRARDVAKQKVLRVYKANPEAWSTVE